jgi:hypothetical protein
MTSATSSSSSHGSVLTVVVILALAARSSPRRLGASAAAAESGGPNWHVVSVSSLLPSLACTAAAEGMCKTPISYVKLTLDLVALLISISTIPSTC